MKHRNPFLPMVAAMLVILTNLCALLGQTPPSPAQAILPSKGELIISSDTARTMSLQTSPLQDASEGTHLRLTGQLMLDPSRLVHVHTRFNGEVIRVGTLSASNDVPVRAGHTVHQGQILAVIWSKEVGELKSDLVDALSQLYLHETLYKNLKSLEVSGAVAQRNIEEIQRSYEADLILVERYRRTLSSWRVPAEQLKQIDAEAQRIHARAVAGPGAEPPVDVARSEVAEWAEVEIVAPIDGTIIEKNVTIGDIVSTDADLFKIADFSQLVVMANIYEEDLPTLLSLPEAARVWQVNSDAVELS